MVKAASETSAIPRKLIDNCPKCRRITRFTFADEVEDPDEWGAEYLYTCDDCRARVWFGESEAKAHDRR